MRNMVYSMMFVMVAGGTARAADNPEAMKKKAAAQSVADAQSLALSLITCEDTKDSPAALLLAAELLHKYPIKNGQLKASDSGSELSGKPIPDPIDLIKKAKENAGDGLNGLVAKTERMIAERGRGRFGGSIGGVTYSDPYQTGIYQHEMQGGDYAFVRFNTIGGGNRSITVTDQNGNVVASGAGPSIQLTWYVPFQSIYTIRVQNLEGYRTQVNWFVR